ncbi:MAG: MFS transporter [Candidatus Faecousia sp.]|nr:MFS transporter [Candidatus Faecousia sp.]
MSKPESPARMEKRKLREARELRKWEKIQNAPKSVHYFAILMVVLTIVYIVDEITSNINSAMQPQILFDLFNITSRDVNDPAYASAINSMALVSLCTMLFLFLAPFYKSLCDRFGRKLFLAINTCMFGVGLLVIMLCPNLYVYMLGLMILGFVTPNDLQVMYIMEVAPKQHRAKLCSITKAIALVSVSLIGVMRNAFMTDSLSSWRYVYIIPAIAAVITGIMSVFFVKETPVFMDERVKYLRSSDAERAQKAAAQKSSESAARGGVLNAIKFIFRHKQIRAVTLTALIFSVSTIYTSYYATIMEGGMTTASVSTALIIYPFANGALTFISGFISDRLGRKRSCMILGSFAMVCLAGFILSCVLGWGPVAAGVLYGASIGALWSVSDTLLLTIPAESVPTEIRASVMGTMSLLLFCGMILGMVLVVVGQNFFPMGWLCLCVCVPFMLVSLLILASKVHETRDVDLDTVTGTEWD